MLTVARDDKPADVDGWVTLTNGSGTAFRNAKLQLVAGDLNRVRQVIGKMMADEMRAERPAAAAAPMAQEAFSDYHLYTLAGRRSINNNETKQVSMLAGTGVPVHKRYVVDGQAFYYRNAQHPGAPIKDVVQVFYQFKNEEKGGLGLPMPAGTVRVYQADSKGGVQFVGEDRIDHTPKDETLNLKIGHAFDVVCERNQIDFEKIATNVYEMEYEITLRNHKSAAHRGRGERADRRDVADAALVARMDQDRRVGGAVQGSRRRGRARRAEVPRPRDLLGSKVPRFQGSRVPGFQGAP